MKLKSISKSTALLLSAVMAGNILLPSVVHAQSRVDNSLIDQSLNAQSAEMRRTLRQINALISSMEKFKAASASDKQGAFVNTARLMITLLGLGSTAIHAKNAQAESSIALTLAAVSGVLSTVLEKYASTQQFDMSQVRALLAQEQSTLTNSLSGASREDQIMISQAISQIATINSDLSTKVNDIQHQIDNGQVGVAVVAIITLVLHYATPYLPARMRAAISEKAPTVVTRLAATKKGSMQGLGAANIATMLSTVVGLSGPGAQSQLNRILSNLYVAKANLLKEIGN